jgi:hypothetical protein
MPRVVKTAPCPKCRSHRTDVTLHDDGTVIIRACNTCTWTWDAYDGEPDQFADGRQIVREARA